MPHREAIFAALLATVSACLGALLWLSARAATERAVALFGHNTDSGAYAYIAACFFCVPAAVIFGATALLLTFKRAPSNLLQRAMWVWLASPFVILLALALFWRFFR